MKHGREDYAPIQDTSGNLGIPDNEPVFLIRAQDKLSSQILRMWAVMASANGASQATVKSALAQAKEMDKWLSKKTPDLPF